MITRTISKLRAALLGALAAALVLTTTTALAGSGVGGVFNLGTANTVDAQTTLSGNPGANPLLRLTGAGTAATIRADAGSGIAINGISTSGTGQSGQSTSGHGLSGFHVGATGSTSGVYGQTNSTDPGSAGVTGRNLSGGPGLQSIVTGNTVPPLKVNSSAKVANLNADLLDGFDSAGLPYWKRGGNAGTTPGTDFLGTTDNKALELKVNGQRALRLEPTTGGLGTPGSPNLVGGLPANSVDTGRVGSVIAGGGTFVQGNRVQNDYDFIGAGFDNAAGAAGGNVASAIVAGTHNAAPVGWGFIGAGDGNSVIADYDFVGAGADNHAGSATGGGASAVVAGTGNVASGGSAFIGAGGINHASDDYAFVGAGQANTASGIWSTVSGGHTNTASGDTSTVGGGDDNTASGLDSTVPGGYLNTASGDYSLAAGSGARATQAGSFVWDDASGFFVDSPAANTFTVQAAGGIWLGTNSSPSIGGGRFIDTSTGAYLTSTGTWTNNSDRTKKHDLKALNTRTVLDKVARMPITSWSYKAEKPSVRHIGPMAQDFYKAFGLGLDDKHITTIDEGGVALARDPGPVPPEPAPRPRQPYASRREPRAGAGKRGPIDAARPA